MALVCDLERQLYHIEDSVLEKQASVSRLDVQPVVYTPDIATPTTDTPIAGGEYPRLTGEYGETATPIADAVNVIPRGGGDDIDDGSFMAPLQRVSPGGRVDIRLTSRTQGKENSLPAVYVPRKSREKSVNKWKTPIQAQDICTRNADTTSKVCKIYIMYAMSLIISYVIYIYI